MKVNKTHKDIVKELRYVPDGKCFADAQEGLFCKVKLSVGFTECYKTVSGHLATSNCCLAINLATDTLCMLKNDKMVREVDPVVSVEV